MESSHDLKTKGEMRSTGFCYLQLWTFVHSDVYVFVVVVR